MSAHTPVQFAAPSEFTKDLKRAFHAHPKAKVWTSGAPKRQILTILFFATGFIGSYLLLLLLAQSYLEVLLFSTVCAFSLSGLGSNLFHDAAHGNITKKKRLGKALAYGWDICGVSSFLYKQKHVQFHHKYTNINHYDGDLDEASPLFKLSPFHEHKSHQKFQFIYFIFAYSLLTLSWVFAEDMMRWKNLKVINHPMVKPSGFDTFLFWFFKLFHIFIFVILPSVFHPFLYVIFTYFLVHMIMSLMMTAVFQLAHIQEHCTYYPSTHNQVSEDWMTSQLKSTSNFAVNNKMATWFLGSLNLQIEHHLFPSVAAAHLPEISLLVQKVSQEHNLPYHHHKNFFTALKAHISYLYQLGHQK